jgi:hypothetical protein
LWRHLRVDAAGAEKKQFARTVTPSRVDHMGLDQEILADEVGWMFVVVLNSTDPRRSEVHLRRSIFGKEIIN